VEGLSVGGREEVESGVYCGWAGLDLGKQGNEVGALRSFPLLRLAWGGSGVWWEWHCGVLCGDCEECNG